MKVIASKKLRSDRYRVYKRYTAGLVLKGWEAKSIRRNKATLKNAFCFFKHNELFLINMHVACWMLEKCDPTAERKLLLHKQELKKLKLSLATNHSILLPHILFWSNKYIKLEIVEAKAIKKSERRAFLKEKQAKKEAQKEIRLYL